MSTLKTGALRGTSGTADSIQLHASNQSVTFPGNVTCSGTATGFASPTDGEYRGWVVYDSASAHTWTKPSGLKRIKVYVTGGGGGGGGHNAGESGAGGTAGGTAIKVIEAGSLGATETATVGAGGAGGDPGGDGVASSFGSHCSATGGVGGEMEGGGSTYMNGGVGSGGDINIRGQGSTSLGSGNQGSNGGSSYWGGGGGGGINYSRPHGGSGTYGSGGGGGYQTGSGAAGNGGNGGIGLIVVEQYF